MATQHTYSGDEKQYCTTHKKKEIEVYCRDCHKPCCSVCVMEHRDHVLADVDEVDQEMREIVMKLKMESEKKNNQLKKHSDFLKTKIADMDNSCDTACDQVQKQINAICAKVRRIGGTIKDNFNTFREDENRKLTKLLEDDDKMTSEMTEWCEHADRVLQHRSIITAVDKDGLTDVKTKTDYIISKILHRPVVRKPYYPMVEVDEDYLKNLFGGVQVQTPILELKPVSPTKFTSIFRFNPQTQDKYYFSDELTIQGLSWTVRVNRDISMSNLYTCLELKNAEDETIDYVKVIYTLKVLNISDESKSLIIQETHTLVPDKFPFKVIQIKLNKLLDDKEGFVGDNETITVEITVEITEIHHETGYKR